MNLYLDVGNTSTKWLMDHNGECVGRGRDISFSTSLFANSIKRLSDICLAKVSRVVVSNVAGAEKEQGIREYILEYLSLHAEFVFVEPTLCNVRVSYRPLESLGVDRWLAMIAAYNEFRGACLVIDAGSAITVDFVDSSGSHHGGKIAPGFNLLGLALRSNTAGVRFDGLTFDKGRSLGQSTQSCVAQGVEAMLDGFVGQILALHSANADHIVFSGGDAKRLIPTSLSKAYLREDLVFDGLKVWANVHLKTK